MNTTQHIHLEGIARPMPARTVRDLVPGDTIVYNFGYMSEVLSVVLNKTGKSCTLTTRALDTGKVYTRTKRADTLVAISTT